MDTLEFHSVLWQKQRFSFVPGTPKKLEPQEGPKSSVLRMIFNSNYQYFGSPNDWDLEGAIKSQQIKQSLHNFDIILFSLSLLDSQGALKSQSGLKFGVLKR